MHHATVIGIILLFLGAQQAEGDELRISCPIEGMIGEQCSNDCTQLGFCDGINNWLPILTCPTGTLCINLNCVESSSCPTATVLCGDSSLKMPNLDDNTCNTYYTCEMSTGSALGTGVLQRCPTGTVFNACSGECGYGSCTTYSDTHPQDYQILSENFRLAYVFLPEDTVYWSTCPNGIYLMLSGSVSCYEISGYSCLNGIEDDEENSSEDGYTCNAAGRFPVAGNNCVYIQCYSDLSYIIFTCRSGYHYDVSAKECISGSCTSNALLLGDVPAEGRNNRKEAVMKKKDARVI